MAEEVEISNVGGDGVASEVTMARLVTAVEAMAKKSGIDSKGAAVKLQNLYNKATTEGIAKTKTNTTATSQSAAATKRATQQTNKFAKTLGNTLGASLSSITTSFTELGKMFFAGGTSVSDFATKLPVIGSKLGFLASFVDESTEAFRNLSASGAAFGNNITTMRNAAAGMEMSLSEMGDLFTQNSDRLASLGGTVSEGAARFQQMNKNIKATGDFNNLKEMGFTVMEINEGMTDYIELQARMGTLQGKSTQELAAGSADYLTQIDRLAKVTGKTREEAEKALAAQATDAGVRSLLNALGEGTDEFKNLQMSLALIDEVGGSAGAAMKDLLDGMASGPETAQFLAMMGDAGPAMQDALKQIGDGADPQVLLNAMKNSGGELEKFAGKDAAARKQYIDVIRDQNPTMAEFLDGATKMIDIGKRNLADAKSEQDKRDEITKAMTTFDDTMRQVSGALQKAFVDSGVLSLIASGLTTFADMLVGVAESIKAFGEKMSNGEWVSAIIGIIGDGLAGIWENKGVIGALIGGILGLFAAKAVVGAMGKGIAGLAGKLNPFSSGETSVADSVGGKSSTPGKSSKPGKGIASLGKGIGKGLGRILGGLAKGISAFANPAVVAGAASLGATIVLIGGAIAGATWMVGKALPTMAEGMKSFEELDGAKLISAGKGMAAIALGMAAFGASSAVSGLGNLVGSVTDGIAGLFGAEDPLEKIKKFQEYSFDAARIENNASAIVSYSKGMAALGAAEGISGIGAAVNAVGSGIASLFGAEDPLTGLTRFQTYNFDTAKIRLNAEAVSAYAEAMRDFPSSPSASVFGALKDGIIGLLGGNTDPMAPIKAFGEMSFNTNGIIANASAVKAYADAMKDFPTSPSASVFTALKDGIISLLGGNTDPMAPIKSFGEMSFNTNGIIANASAVKSYAEAMKDFPTSPSASVFTALKDGIIGLLGGETDPFAPMKAFGDLSLDAAGIVTNAGAVKAYAEAMKDFPDSPSVSVLSSLKTGIVSLFGGETDPFASLIEFGNLSLNSSGILNNAEAVKAYAQAMSSMPQIDGERTGGVVGAIAGFFSGDTQMPWDKVKAFGEADLGNTESILNNANVISAFNEAVAGISSSGGLMPIADGMTAIAGVQGLQSNLDILNAGLDTVGVVNYTVAMQNLVDTLQELNLAMAEERTANTNQQTTESANSAMANIASSDAATSSNQLNTIMEQVLSVLHEMKDLDGKVEKNTRNIIGSNIARGSVSNVG